MFGSETIVFFMQLHLPFFFWDSCQYAVAPAKILGIMSEPKMCHKLFVDKKFGGAVRVGV